MTREETKKHFQSWCQGYIGNNASDEDYRMFNNIMALLEQEPKMGRWIEHFDESGKWYECDQCHTDWGGPVNYCPNCGTRMQEVEE